MSHTHDERTNMITTRNSRWTIAALFMVAAGCASPGVSTSPVPEPGEPPSVVETPGVPRVERAPVPPSNPALPEVPRVVGPLAIKVVYPPAEQLIQARDSNFIFGSVGNGDAGLTINGRLAPVWPNGSFMAWLPVPPRERPVYDLVATTGIDTVRLSLPVKLPAPVTGPPTPPDSIVRMSPARYAALIGPASYASDTERVVTAYSPAGGIQRWFLLPGTVVKVIGTRGNDAFVQLDTAQTIRIEKNDLALAAATERAPASIVASAFKLQQSAEWSDITVPATSTPAFRVEEGPSSITLTLYGTKGPARRQSTANGTADSYVRSVTAVAAGAQMRYIIDLRGPIYGYQPLHEKGNFTFRVRKPPSINSAAPLRGLTIAVDPGHPPVGATGPTGLWEPVAALAVGLKVRDLLQGKGATVVLTRDSPEPVDLNLRSTIARRANAHALVSIHLNAVPDGVNPFRAQGTATYHYHLHSAPLAQAIQTAAVGHLGLPNHGVKRENFALVRGPWMPAVLVEGAFIIIPEQEAALKTPEYQARYAQAIVDGLEAYFRSLSPAPR